MKNNEIMNEGIENVMEDVVANESTGVSTGVAIAIGVGIACAIGVGVKLMKKGIAAYKAKKELRKPDTEVYVDDKDVEDVVSD